MQKIVSIPFSIIAYILFFFFLILFQPIQWFCFNVFGYKAHKKSVECLNFLLIGILYFLISDFEVENRELIPEGKPLIFVANHQGLYDVIGVTWFLRKFHPKFVSKKELGKGIPSVSYNLNHGGSILIDRNDPKQALPLLKKLAEYIETQSHSAVIFPEGTRTKDGHPKPFAINGLKILCKYAPSAYVIPITINNSWKVFRYGSFPLGIGNHLKFTIHKPLKVNDMDFNLLFENTEKAIISDIKI